ncbi:MAG: HNH endonuclease [Thermoplasmata archaeon]|nr:HNH endonuclease [Thermoplasmata archaeon]
MGRKEEEEELPAWAVLLVLFVAAIAIIWASVPHIYLYLSLIIIVLVFIIATYYAYTKKNIFLPTALTKYIWNWYKREYREREKREGKASRKRSVVPPLSSEERYRLIHDVAHHRCEFPGCNIEYGLEVHHIIPRSEGGSNKQSNLIVLCPTHHRMAHRGSIPRDELKYIVKKRKSSK